MRVPASVSETTTASNSNVAIANDENEPTKSQNGQQPPANIAINSNPSQKVLDIVEKKIRNLEKRRQRLQQLREDVKSGKKLTDDQVEAVSRIGEVDQQLEFAKDLHKTVQAHMKESNKAMKDALKRESRERQQAEITRIADILHYQELSNLLGKANVKRAFSLGTDGAVQLSDEELQLCDKVYEALCPTMEGLNNDEWRRKLEISANRAYLLATGSPKCVIDTSTGKSLKDLLDRIAGCEYMSQLHSVPTVHSSTANSIKEDESVSVSASISPPLPDVDPAITYQNFPNNVTW